MNDTGNRNRPTWQQLRELLPSIDFYRFREAWDFSRLHGTSLWDYADAQRSNLDMLPSWVDPRGGLVLDIGANEGDWTRQLTNVFPDARVLAFEPGPQPCAIFEERFGENLNVTLDRRAVGAQSGRQTFYSTRASVFASLLPPSSALHDLYDLPGQPTEVLETFDVETVRLDDLVQEQISVVKLDVQGGERSVLEGGERVLRGADAVLVEIVFQTHYEGDSMFGELHKCFERLGFALHDIGSPFRLDGPALWADACYARAAATGAVGGGELE